VAFAPFRWTTGSFNRWTKRRGAFITEEDARRALEDCLRDEPGWRGLLEVKEIELDHERHFAQLADLRHG
jgi:hypothetical protein